MKGGLDAVLPPFPSDEPVGYKSELPGGPILLALGDHNMSNFILYHTIVMLASVYCSTLAFWRLIFHRKTILP
jgi:hypothetical protein